MKYFTWFFVLIVIYETEAEGTNYWLGQGHDYEANHGYRSYDHVEKPCHIQDVACIKRYLEHNFGCYPVHGHAPESYFVRNFSLDMPNGNASAVVNDARLYNLDSGRIKTFFIDPKEDTMVLEVQFDSVLMKSPRVVLKYHRKGNTPLKKIDFVMYEFRDLSLTWTMEGIHDKYGANNHVYAYMPDAYPSYKVGRGLLLSDGYKVSNEEWYDRMNLSIVEAMITQGPAIMTAYLKTMICDFGQL